MIERGRTAPETEREKKVLHPAKRGSLCASAAVRVVAAAEHVGLLWTPKPQVRQLARFGPRAQDASEYA
jgi:hypothetical protein